MRDHNKLRAFELSDELVLLIYKITKHFPKEEVYGLTSQLRRAAVSVPSNIVEGCARKTDPEYKRFLDMAFGSLREVKYQFSLACRLGYVMNNVANECELKIIETEKVLAALIRSLR
ncbi:MAG TPA: four helix bundle protein [Bacteroidales bacterium]|nr:four helix bundle protein [Bacteroidales bacterium]